MLRGELVLLRARTEDDARVLHAELYEDTETFVRADNRPWVPVPFGPGSPHWPKDVRSASDAAVFAVTELATGDLAGEALLWGIDLHNRSAHVGLSLRPACRGRGLGADVVRVLCRYGFAIRGLHRLQLETLSDNHAMITVADRLGFTREGTARASSWVAGQWADDAVFGLLDTEFTGLVFALGCESSTGRILMHNCLRRSVGFRARLCTGCPPLSPALATACTGVAHSLVHNACGKPLRLIPISGKATSRFWRAELWCAGRQAKPATKRRCPKVSTAYGL